MKILRLCVALPCLYCYSSEPFNNSTREHSHWTDTNLQGYYKDQLKRLQALKQIPKKNTSQKFLGNSKKNNSKNTLFTL